MGVEESALEDLGLIASLVSLIRQVWANPVLRFLFVSGSNTLLYAVLSLLFMWILPFSKQASSTLAYFLGIPVAFLGYEYLVFRAGTDFSHSEVLRFLTTHAINLVVSYGMVWALCDKLGLLREVGVFASCVAFAIIGYALIKIWVFRVAHASRRRPYGFTRGCHQPRHAAAKRSRSGIGPSGR